MKITVTALCSFCARRFNAMADAGLVHHTHLVCEDGDGRLCCWDCYHELCGRGHITRADRDECAAEHGVPDEPVDVWGDVGYEVRMDNLLGVG